MKKTLAAFLVLSLMIAAPMLAAKKRHKKAAPVKTLQWFVAGGPSFPTGDLGIAGSTGFTASGGAEQAFTFGHLLYKIAYSSWGSSVASVPGIKFPSFSALDFMADYKYNFKTGSSVSPYVLGGAGLRRAASGGSTVTFLGTTVASPGASQMQINIELGGGVEIPVSTMLLFFEAGINVGGDFNDLPIRVGLKF